MAPYGFAKDTVLSVPGNKPNPYVPKIGTVEHMSTMAGTITQTNEIYGPRLPKQKYAHEVPPSIESPPRMYPKIYGPGNPPGSELGGVSETTTLNPADIDNGGTGGMGGTGGAGGAGGAGGGMESIYASKDGEIGAGDLSVLSTGPNYKPIAKINTNNAIKMEPVPFLNDFSKFYR
jgi:hypothetical protein